MIILFYQLDPSEQRHSTVTVHLFLLKDRVTTLTHLCYSTLTCVVGFFFFVCYLLHTKLSHFESKQLTSFFSLPQTAIFNVVVFNPRPDIQCERVRQASVSCCVFVCVFVGPVSQTFCVCVGQSVKVGLAGPMT